MPFLTGSDPGTNYRIWSLPVPHNLAFRAALRGVLLDLTNPQNWEQTSASYATPERYAELAQAMYDNITVNDD